MRLIDADELIEHAWRDKLDSRELIAEMIEKAPTIKKIPIKIPVDIDVFEKLISQEPVLDKIRAEVKALPNANPSYSGYIDVVDREDVLEIIDKYKAESGDKK